MAAVSRFVGGIVGHTITFSFGLVFFGLVRGSINLAPQRVLAFRRTATQKPAPALSVLCTSVCLRAKAPAWQ